MLIQAFQVQDYIEEIKSIVLYIVQLKSNKNRKIIENKIPDNQEDNHSDIYYDDSSVPYDFSKDMENYRYPTIDLLKKYDYDGTPYVDMEEQQANKNCVVDTLRSFGIEISSIKATVGPRVTLYEITLAPGVNASKLRGLEDDIALALSSHNVQILIPIPGKGTIGIEVVPLLFLWKVF